MNERTRTAWLGWALRLTAIAFILGFVPWITLILLGAPVMEPGSQLAPMLRYEPFNHSYEGMLAVIHIVWAVMLWRASRDPSGHASLIDFTIWASLAHAAYMLVDTPSQKGWPMTVVEVLPLLLIAAALIWLRPRPAFA